MNESVVVIPPKKDSVPHAVPAERAVLGALLINNESFHHVEDGLHEEWFYDGRHRIIFSTMMTLYREGYVDPVTLSQRLQSHGRLAEAGGNDYLAEIADTGAAPVNVPAYVDLIRDTAFIRSLIVALQGGMSEVFAPGDKTPQKLLDDSEARLSEVGRSFMRGFGGFNSVDKLVNDYFEKISDVAQTGDYDSLRGVASGFPRLDDLTAGMHPGELTVLAGRPGAGKTAFALNVVRHIASNPNTGVICFSLEMSASQLAVRMLSHIGINPHSFRAGRKFSSDDLRRLAHAVAEMDNLNIWIDDSSMLDILDARTRARRVKREMEARGDRLGLVMVDYLQLMEAHGGDKNQNRAQEVSLISHGLKALAKELKVPVLALAQLNRSIETRRERRPQLSDLRESGAIEQDADLILFLHYDNEGAGEPEPQDATEVQLIIGKHRNGPTGSVKLRFERNFSKFTELADDADAAKYMPPGSYGG
jgi:replicative DNA helicase